MDKHLERIKTPPHSKSCFWKHSHNIVTSWIHCDNGKCWRYRGLVRSDGKILSDLNNATATDQNHYIPEKDLPAHEPFRASVVNGYLKGIDETGYLFD